MADPLTKERRSWNMSRIPGKNTRPELAFRSLLHRAGFRFRLHDPGLPGKPDVVLKKYMTAIFVHGCFWHRHKDCKNATTPSTHPEFWSEKFKRTIERDERKARELQALGWNVITVWACDISGQPDALIRRIKQQLKRGC